jgi:hypothetical protein
VTDTRSGDSKIAGAARDTAPHAREREMTELLDACSRCPYTSFDYCARCQAPLCEECMKAGCCGTAPAVSGVEQDFDDHIATVQEAYYGDRGLPAEDVVGVDQDDEAFLPEDDDLEMDRVDRFMEEFHETQ